MPSIRVLAMAVAALSGAATVLAAPVEGAAAPLLEPAYVFDLPGVESDVAAMASVRVYFCQNANWGGDCATLDVPEGTCAGIPSVWNDRISSIRNEASGSFRCIWYEHGGCSGASYDNQNDANLGDGNGRFNDFISSLSCNRK